MKSGKVILNLDESWLNTTQFTARHWTSPTRPRLVVDRRLNYRVTLVLAIDSLGNLFYAMADVNSSNDLMLIFLTSLVELLDQKRPAWRRDTIVLLDGAPYHTSKRTLELLSKLDVPTVISGPYSYAGAPVERVFAFLKSGDLNPKAIPVNSSKSYQPLYFL